MPSGALCRHQNRQGEQTRTMWTVDKAILQLMRPVSGGYKLCP